MRNLGAMLLGSLPGFIVPIVVISRLPPNSSDSLLLAISIALVVTTIAGSTLEASYTARAINLIGAGLTPARSAMVAAILRSASFGAIGTAALYPALSLVYGLSSGRTDLTVTLLTSLLPIALAAPISCASAPIVGTLVANGRIPRVLISQAFKGLPAILAVLLTTEITVIALVIVAGEALRTWYLFKGVEHAAPATGRMEFPKIVTLLNQIGSVSISQLLPIYVRAALASAGLGAISSGDMAIRLYSGANQVMSSAVVLPAVAAVPKHIRESADARQYSKTVVLLMLRTARSGAIVAAVLATATVAAYFGADKLGLDDDLITGLSWAPILLTALPSLGLNILGSRILLMHGISWPFPLIALTSLTVAVGVGQISGSAVGAILGFALAQTVAGVLSLAMVMRATRAGPPEQDVESS